MFSPDADVSPYDPSTSTVTIKPDAVPRVVKHENTRMTEQETGGKSLSAPPSPTHSRIDAAIEGIPCEYSHTSVPISRLSPRRSPQITNHRRLLASSQCTIAHCGTDGCKGSQATHDVGDIACHASNYIPIR